ncbi:MAG: hypothetical protein IPM18_04020 [Phycisphaerales bacterium]|nr:hypothetical protein [Phycisphaerales bacterium]
MTPEQDRLEHLFSRFLDDECTSEERALVRRLIRTDATARALFDEMHALDLAVGTALRTALRPALRLHNDRWRPWRQIGMAAAACLAFVLLLPPATEPLATTPGVRPGTAAATASWFVNGNDPVRDWIAPTDPSYERPEVRVRGLRSDWVVIPGEAPDQYFLIEVEHVGLHKLRVHADF